MRYPAIPGNDGKTRDSGILKPLPPPDTDEVVGVSATAETTVHGAPTMGGRPGISGVLSRMLPGVPQDDLYG